MVQAEERFDRRIVFRTRLVLSPTHLLIGGLLLIPGFIVEQSLVLRYAEIAGYMILAAACGKRVLILPNLLMIAGIVAANLLSPLGRVLLSIGPLPITEGAIEDGLYKASMLIGLIYLSRVAVREDLVLPGRFGSLIAQTFSYFGLIAGARGTVVPRNTDARASMRPKRSLREVGDRLVEQVDLLLRRLESGNLDGAAKASTAPLRSSPSGLVAMGVLVLVNSGAAYLGRFVP